MKFIDYKYDRPDLVDIKGKTDKIFIEMQNAENAENE